jgi:hypothetical protein
MSRVGTGLSLNVSNAQRRCIDRRRREQACDCGGQFITHRFCGGAAMVERLLELPAVKGPEPTQQESIAEAADDRIVVVIGFGRAKHEADLAGPGQRPAAVGAEVPGPRTIIDFAQGGERLGLGVRPHAKDRAKVFQHQDSKLPDLVQQTALGVFCRADASAFRSRVRRASASRPPP